MKQLFLLLILLVLRIHLIAQPTEHFPAVNERQLYKGYTIRLFTNAGQGYGYDILLGSQLLIHQGYHPFTLDPRGLNKKEDAYKVARWQIDQLKPEIVSGKSKSRTAVRETFTHSRPATKGQQMPYINQRLPHEIARELHIELQ
jgi:hypothetical protein